MANDTRKYLRWIVWLLLVTWPTVFAAGFAAQWILRKLTFAGVSLPELADPVVKLIFIFTAFKISAGRIFSELRRERLAGEETGSDKEAD